ncbi:hypothetical protein CAPTEDRAFT_97945 [Capitella teleta]|uniref:Pyrroline-5-carboxylate reductase catalytic N-terminal domain-containing protein n=1 Tax=Capitella teleta TaxID=283909 RepID=R7UYZ3_CAPTE|nr:hypothetical protein CAPTEDRAFT_97945 [Capitella teleta]|eukprot:ELU11793.1 hypothetical protein CAPTEDRAFT_97945 [Capitella teleta]
MAKFSPELSVSVIGTGDFGRALAGRLIQGGYTIHMGSQDPGGRREFLEAVSPALVGVSIVKIREAIQLSNVILLAINSDKHESLKQYSDILNEKILIDVSNPDRPSKTTSAAEKLQAMLPTTYVCKAFNTSSAYVLSASSSISNKTVNVCANDIEVRTIVKRMATDMGLQAVDAGGLQSARQLEQQQQTLCLGWGWATVVTGVWLALWILYVGCEKFVFGNHSVDSDSLWPLTAFNVVLASMAINQLALCYLPGCLAAFIQIAKGTKYKAFPRWLDLWLKMRKQLGLYGLIFAIMHACVSLIVFSHRRHRGPPRQGGSPQIIAVLATLFYIILGITSLPSVGALLNWREWRFVQSYLGHLCLLLSCVHACLLKFEFFHRLGSFMIIIQQPEVLCQLLAFAALALRLILWMPCISSYVWKIRKGYVRGGTRKDPEQGKAANGHTNETYQEEIQPGNTIEVFQVKGDVEQKKNEAEQHTEAACHMNTDL